MLVKVASGLRQLPIHQFCARWLWQPNSWWRHEMETFSALLTICAGNSPVPGEFPAQRPVTRSFDVFFDLRLNKRLRKQSWGWWFETPSRPLWRHRNVSNSSFSFSITTNCETRPLLPPQDVSHIIGLSPVAMSHINGLSPAIAIMLFVDYKQCLWKSDSRINTVSDSQIIGSPPVSKRVLLFATMSLIVRNNVHP